MFLIGKLGSTGVKGGIARYGFKFLLVDVQKDVQPLSVAAGSEVLFKNYGKANYTQQQQGVCSPRPLLPGQKMMLFSA